MENGKYGVVLIGCGHIGQSHIEEIYYREEIRVAGVVDIHAETAGCSRGNTVRNPGRRTIGNI